MDGNSLMFCGMRFQTVGAANRKALRPIALAVRETPRRLSEINVAAILQVHAKLLQHTLISFYCT